MREADVAIRLRQPTQPDLIQRKLFSVRFHAYASPEYLKRFGTPRTLDDLDNHRVVVLGGTVVPNHFENRRWLIEVARDGKGPRAPVLTTNTVLGVLRACQRGIGRRAAAGLSGRGERRAGAIVRRIGLDRARCLFRLSRRTEIGRARAGVPRLPGGEGAALAFLEVGAPALALDVHRGCTRRTVHPPLNWLRPPHGWHAALCVVWSDLLGVLV